MLESFKFVLQIGVRQEFGKGTSNSVVFKWPKGEFDVVSPNGLIDIAINDIMFGLPFTLFKCLASFANSLSLPLTSRGTLTTTC